MSRPLKEPKGYIEELFNTMWNEKYRVILPRICNLEKDRVVGILASEVEKFLLTHPYREQLNLRHDVKNNTIATEIRNQGNKMFHPRVKRYIEAIKYYNESITLAEKGTEERALAYGNRSIVCLELHQYEDCLKNIRLARESNYPARLAGKLKKREADAKQALAKATKNTKGSTTPANEPAQRELKLSYTGHENMPHVAKCLQLQQNDEYGRHVVTDRPLNPGDIVMIDKPFVTVLEDPLRYVRCAYCYHETTFTLIPCEGCTVAMFCSEECLSKAHQQYHRYECAVIGDILRCSANTIPVMAIRTIALAITTFDHDLKSLKTHLDSLDESRLNAFTMNWKVATQKDVYNTVHGLTINQQLRDQSGDLPFGVFYATIVHQLMMERTELGSICEVDFKMKKLLFDLILRYLQIFLANRQTLTFMNYKPGVGLNDEGVYALGCFPLICMLNHSCAPNLCRITLRDGRCAVLVIRPIAEGDQLFVEYGVHHMAHDLERRQTTLRDLFSFRCRCEACENDYPTLEGIPSEGIPYINGLISEELQSNDANKAIKWIPVLKAHLKKKEQIYLSQESCVSRVQLKCCFDLLYGYTSKLSSCLKYCNP